MFRGVGELRVKESDRLAGGGRPGAGLRGARPRSTATTWWCTGRRPLSPAAVDAGGDHRMAMAAAVAGAGAAEPSRHASRGCESVATSYPGFADRPGTSLAGTAEREGGS